MKTNCLWILLLALCSTFATGKIKNGYAGEQAKESLKVLQAIVNDRLTTTAERRTYYARIRTLVDFITCYELTNILLQQFKSIDPELYAEIDSIRDRRGRSTDVYVKFVPQDQSNFQVLGTTNVSQSAVDADMYSSEYGDGSVSVKVLIVSKALVVLAHEFGHVKVQVPTLAEYLSFYNATYSPATTETNLLGHEYNDPSGRCADACAKHFLTRVPNLFRKGSELPDSPCAIQARLRRSFYETVNINKTTWL